MPKLKPEPCLCGGETTVDIHIGWTLVRCVEPKADWPHTKGCGLKFERWEDRETTVRLWNNLRSSGSTSATG
jgi:hypothetical protein